MIHFLKELEQTLIQGKWECQGEVESVLDLLIKFLWKFLLLKILFLSKIKVYIIALY